MNRTFLIILLVGLAIGAAAYFYKRKKDQQAEAKKKLDVTVGSLTGKNTGINGGAGATVSPEVAAKIKQYQADIAAAAASGDYGAKIAATRALNDLLNVNANPMLKQAESAATA